MTITIFPNVHSQNAHTDPTRLQADNWCVTLESEQYDTSDDGGEVNASAVVRENLSIDAAYKLAKGLVWAANKRREELRDGANPTPEERAYRIGAKWYATTGPFVILPARKKTEAEIQAEIKAEAERIAGIGTGAEPISEEQFTRQNPGARLAARDIDYAGLSAGKLVDTCGLDAAKWAAAFMQLVVGKETLAGKALIDEGLMIAWFANAIETAKTAALREKDLADENALIEARDR